MFKHPTEKFHVIDTAGLQLSGGSLMDAISYFVYRRVIQNAKQVRVPLLFTKS